MVSLVDRRRVRTVSVEEFKRMLAAKAIRGATLNEVSSREVKRPLYEHPNTKAWYIAKDPIEL